MSDSLGGPALEEAAHSSPGAHNDPTLPPELNPIQNPLLAANLGRWAHVYFTAEPENRDKAVRELLIELKKEQSSFNVSVSTPSTTADGLPTAVCPACKRATTPSQKFCGFCGMDLTAGSVSANGKENRTTQTASGSLSAPSTFDSALPELASLRQASFSTAYDDEEPEGQGWKYAIAVLVIVGLLGSLAYLQWGNTIRAAMGLPPEPPHAVTQSSQSKSSPPNAANNSATQPLPAEGAIQTTPSSAARSQPPVIAAGGQPPADAASASAGDPTAPGASTPNAPIVEDKPGKSDQPPPRPDLATQTAPAPSSTSQTPASSKTRLTAQQAAPADNGSQELLIAENYLNGTPGTRNAAIAAQWLWKAVSKQNATALVLLSDLYRNGEGVSKNCAQARLLLVAAAKRGVPEAGPKLRSFESAGCP